MRLQALKAESGPQFEVVGVRHWLGEPYRTWVALPGEPFTADLMPGFAEIRPWMLPRDPTVSPPAPHARPKHVDLRVGELGEGRRGGLVPNLISEVALEEVEEPHQIDNGLTIEPLTLGDLHREHDVVVKRSKEKWPQRAKWRDTRVLEAFLTQNYIFLTRLHILRSSR